MASVRRLVEGRASSRAWQLQLRGEGGSSRRRSHSFPNLSGEPFPRTCLCVLVSG